MPSVAGHGAVGVRPGRSRRRQARGGGGGPGASGLLAQLGCLRRGCDLLVLRFRAAVFLAVGSDPLCLDEDVNVLVPWPESCLLWPLSLQEVIGRVPLRTR
ncbi:hypothetical protein ABZ941_28015 [Streptomyces rubiginosohelvolus]|uniref:hypothetical protein n=1 Tax=Streptomyces rubiginosohelvolus TaxID=67362 RepID=UPI0033F63C45